MKPPQITPPLAMVVGAGLGVLFGEAFVSLFSLDNVAIVWAFCFLGIYGGWRFANKRESAQDRRNLALGLVPGAADLVNQKSFLEGTFTEAKSAYREITVHAVAAERFLKAADKDFADSAFAPFWDQIERTANELAAYKNSVEQLGRCIHVYQREAFLLENTPDAAPALQLGEHKLPDARPLAERFSALVRQAQTNFQFAMIYEQRKTNQLLYAGFGTLGAAIYALGESVNLSLTQLSKTTNRSLTSLLNTSNAQADFRREIKDRQKDSQEALDRTYHGRLDG
jgi:hypothetical protein